MITPKEYYILAFDTTTDAMQGEKFLKDLFNIAIMPAPREISSGCGLSIRFQDSDEVSIVAHLKENPIIKGTLYRLSTKRIKGKRETTKLYPL